MNHITTIDESVLIGPAKNACPDDLNEALRIAIESHEYICNCEEDYPHDENDLWVAVVTASADFDLEKSVSDFITEAEIWLEKNIKYCTDF